ncbi:hypothetical protein phiA047_0005 [Aeromonas phage phiA047]|nr:hypothetical protein phiA047_0005 [Aeromonas phage phiA047]
MSKREKLEDFIGWKSPDGKLEVIGVFGRNKHNQTLYKVTCTECSKDKELFPDGYFVSLKGDLVRGVKPCGCSKKPEWLDWQYLILARRTGEKKGFIVNGFAEEFHRQNTKLNLECLKDGHKWTASITSVVNVGNGCPKCSGNARPTEQEALQKCIDICKEMDYDVVGFVDGYKNNKSRFEYLCKIHGKQNISYNKFVNGGRRCGSCAKDENIRRLREDGNGNGYYPERKDEQDYLYILNFNDKFIKVGRSFDVDTRIKDGLIYESGLRDISKIHKLRIFTATHQEIYDYEQELHKELRERGFQYYVDWSTECFENDSLFVLNKVLDNCGLTEIEIRGIDE